MLDHTLLIGHFAGHIASILTMVAYLLRDILWLRLLTIVSCFAGITFNYVVPSTPLWTVIGWNAVFAVINIVQIAIIIRERSGIEFSEEEKELYETLFKSFAPFEFMKLMRLAKWHQVAPGEVLATEGEVLDNVMMIYNGRLSVEKGGKQFAELLDGNFIGEVSFISGGAATATVRAVEPTRYLSWSKKEMDSLLKRNPTLGLAMHGVLNTDLSRKLVRRAPSFTARIPVSIQEELLNKKKDTA